MESPRWFGRSHRGGFRLLSLTAASDSDGRFRPPRPNLGEVIAISIENIAQFLTISGKFPRNHRPTTITRARHHCRCDSHGFGPCGSVSNRRSLTRSLRRVLGASLSFVIKLQISVDSARAAASS
jgi:hypothetical protein